MDALNSSTSSLSLNSSSNSFPPPKQSNIPNKSHSTTESPQLSTSFIRLWRPAAQRNVRNQWSKLASYRQQWSSLSSTGRSHATSLVNSYLSREYMDTMELGVLKDMNKIKDKACVKLFKQQLLHGNRLLVTYKDMVSVVVHMVNAGSSMRCFQTVTSGSPIVKFSSSSEYQNDTGDGGGIPVFTFWSTSDYEILADEVVGMFKSELLLKRLLVIELLSLGCDKFEQVEQVSWSHELYPGETDDLKTCKMLFSEGTSEPVLLLKAEGWRSVVTGGNQSKAWPDREVLQVYLTTWLAEVSLDAQRVDEIFDMIGEEVHANNLGFVSAHR